MTIITGLGNPGKEYENTPHNAGFDFLDYFAKKNDFPAFEYDKYSDSLITEKEGVILCKPQSFMNKSGPAVKRLTEARKLKTENLTVAHDDIDLPLGSFKISKDKGSAGHKGIESLISALKTKNFQRIRIGICPEKKPQDVENFVTKKFSKEKQKTLQEVFSQISLIIN